MLGKTAADFDVIIVGSGFGGSVATLRFAQAGASVCVLERGNWLTREKFEADFDLAWNPSRNAFGINDFRTRGRPVVAWTGSGVGGGSLVYAGALFRLDSFDGFPEAITGDDMGKFYATAEKMLAATTYPSYEPYASLPIVQLMLRAGARAAEKWPQLVEGWGRIKLGISFAPPGGEPGATFTNAYGAPQRYSDPYEHGLLGGDIDTKNSLDRNYLYLAQRSVRPAEIRAMHEVDKIEPCPEGYRVHFRRYIRDVGIIRRLRRRWLPSGLPPNFEQGSLTASHVVISAGSIGSTELLLRNRDLHKTLTGLSPHLGERYSTNGDYLMLMIPWRRAVPAWASLLLAVSLIVTGQVYWSIPAWLLHYGVIWALGRPFVPDLGNNNSTYIRFRGPRNESQGVYIQCGRYPTPGKILGAALLSAVGLYRPRAYRVMSRIGHWLQLLVPPFGAIAHSWPIAMLSMGRDEALGRMALNRHGHVEIRYDLKANRRFYEHVQRLGRIVASSASSVWLPHILLRTFGRLEVPHNQGGVPMGRNAADGVVDHSGRVFGWNNLMVLDGSILPRSPGPNPALTILALAERAMTQVLPQAAVGDIVADVDGKVVARDATVETSNADAER